MNTPSSSVFPLLPSPFPLRLLVAAVSLAVVAVGPAARAGGGPENVLLVVNPESPASLTIANHYVQLRQIPASNVLYLSWDPTKDTTDVDTFRQKILTPVIEAVRRWPAGHIDYVAYSADFPWAISLEVDYKRLREAATAEKPAKPGDAKATARTEALLKVITPTGSLTGLTYLWEPVLAGIPGYFQLRGNYYARPAIAPSQGGTPGADTLSLKANEMFGPDGDVVASGGRRYLLSMMLGVTAGRGNTVPEILSYLRRSAEADGTHPRGTVYYVQNSDIRSRVRQGGFAAAVRELQGLGVQAEIVEGAMPTRKPDVQGVMLGVAGFDWKGSGSTILPGAICDHFTSYGGAMSTGAGQTPLSEFLRYGAAAASGTVAEPYALAEKFPSPRIHVHYARGCSLAEAFYQSVFGPYQLLIVGDPLCRPWANIPKVTAAGLRGEEDVRGSLGIKPEATFAGRARVDRFELFVDGSRTAVCGSGDTLALDTTQLPDGWHEVRVVAIESGNIRSQGRLIRWIRTTNQGRAIDVSVAPGASLRASQSFQVKAKAPGCEAIGVFQGARLLGKIPGEQGQLDIKTSMLGSGPVRLLPIGFAGKSPRNRVFGRPIDVVVDRE